MTGKELRDLRVSLGITLSVAANCIKCTLYTIQSIEKETFCNSLKKDLYEDFLICVQKGLIIVPRSANAGIKSSEARKIKNPVPFEKVKELRKIREKLGISQKKTAKYLNISQNNICEKEQGHLNTSEEQYKALKAFYAREKLKRIFGKENKTEADNK